MANNTLKYILADDDFIYREITTQQLSLIPNLEEVGNCSSALEVSALMQEIFPDLLILDVEMPGLNGIELAKSLQKLPLIIFISSHPSYAAHAFEVDAIDYLVKPVPLERLMRAIEKARSLAEMKRTIATQEGFKTDTNNAFFIKDKHAFLKINYSDVIYIESLGDFVSIYLENGEKKIALVNLKNVESQLKNTVFVRISRTHIINKEKVTGLDSSFIMLNRIQLSIGKTYVEDVMKTIMGDNTLKRFI
jgi:two-component system, LytTR family, response regulator